MYRMLIAGRKLGRCFHFGDLRCVASTVGSSGQNPLVALHRSENGMRYYSAAEVSGFMQELDGVRATLLEKLYGLSQAHRACRTDMRRGLDFVFAASNPTRDQRVRKSRVSHISFGHAQNDCMYAGFDDAQMLHNFGDRPSVRRLPERGLRI
jgi:hypothetical protein